MSAFLSNNASIDPIRIKNDLDFIMHMPRHCISRNASECGSYRVRSVLCRGLAADNTRHNFLGAAPTAGIQQPVQGSAVTVVGVAILIAVDSGF